MKNYENELCTLLNSIQPPLDQTELIQVLKEAHALCGGLPEEVQSIISERLNLRPALLAGLIKITPSLKTAAARHTIVVCIGQHCRSRGSFELLKTVQRELGIETGQVSKDGRFRLETKNCMKNCKSAPNLSIDGKFFCGLQPTELRRLLETYR